MSLTREKLRKEIEDGNFRPVYVLYGEETYLRDNAAKFISRCAFTEGEFRDFNDDQFCLNTPENISTALAAADQLPMMASRRIVRITDVRVSTSAVKDTLKEDAEAALSAYLANPNPSSTVVFVADELNGSRKLGKLLKSQPGAIEFSPLGDDKIKDLSSDVFKRAKVTIEPMALRLLVELVGCDARRITVESEKLATASLPTRVVDVDLVEALVRNTRERSNFDFATHLLAGRNSDAVTALEKVLSDGEEPLALLGALSWKFRDELKRTSQSGSKYADRLAAALVKIAKADLAIKTSVGGSGKASRKQVEMLVCDLAIN
ncbi:MAG: DNA polymerase III subunit delta [Pyrinomonadaceae bacterium]